MKTRYNNNGKQDGHRAHQDHVGAVVLEPHEAREADQNQAAENQRAPQQWGYLVDSS